MIFAVEVAVGQLRLKSHAVPLNGADTVTNTIELASANDLEPPPEIEPVLRIVVPAFTTRKASGME